MISSICLPLVGYFDEHMDNATHCIFAIGFFGGTGIYIFILSNQFNQYKDKFPSGIQDTIAQLDRLKWTILACCVVLGISAN